MDPQKLSQLDPKLRDAYQRVMGTTIPEPQVTPASPKFQRGEPAQTQTPPPVGGPTAPIPDPISTPQPQPQPQPEPKPSEPPTSEPQPAPLIPEPIAEPQPAINPQPQASNFVQMNSEVAASPAAAPTPNFTAPIQIQTISIKKKNNILIPVMFGIAALVFITVYTLFWTKIFNFKLPFLP